ncbi:ATP-binding cassette domain-containing protein [Mucilaginibacter koreensis]
MEDSIVSIQDGRLLYNGHLALSHINITVTKGQHWAIIGPSGSGKTTLLQVLAGNRALNGGNVSYGTPGSFNTQTPLHPKPVMVSLRHGFRDVENTTSFYYQQRYNSFDSGNTATVAEYLSSTSAAANNEINYWTLEQLTQQLHLQPLLPKHLIKLSNGETRRLMIAAALLKNPALLLLDNPLTGLDASSRHELDTLLKETAESGITIILTASAQHIPEVITHIAQLEKGQLVQACRKDELVATVLPNHFDNHRLEQVKQLYTANYKAHRYNYLIRMSNIHIQYGDVKVLDDVNWTVLPGERWSLSGPNGAGKSTLLSLVTGDNPQAYANDIILFDNKRGSGESIWDIKKNIGFISPELYQYFPADQSCLQVIESGYHDTLGLFRPSNPKIMANAIQWMQVFDIEQYRFILLKNVPASVQRLCLLARALVKCPPLLILDEPCQGLDDMQQQHFKSIIDAIGEATQVSIIYVTHYPHEIPDSISHHLRLENGRVAYCN